MDGIAVDERFLYRKLPATEEASVILLLMPSETVAFARFGATFWTAAFSHSLSRGEMLEKFGFEQQKILTKNHRI